MSIRIPKQLTRFMESRNSLEMSFWICPLIENNLNVSLGYLCTCKFPIVL